MKVAILMYHRLGISSSPEEKVYSVTPSAFGEQMLWLHKNRYTIVPLTSVVSFVSGQGSLPERSVALTFDDGYSDFAEHAMPVLSKYRYPSTVFVVADRIGCSSDWLLEEGGRAWPLMGWQQIEGALAAGVSIGSHGLSHRRMSKISRVESSAEIAGSRKFLEDRLGIPVKHIAYPYGDVDHTVAALVNEAGYDAAFTTRSGFNSKGENRFLLRRLDIFGSDTIRSFSIKVTFGTNNGSYMLPLRYAINRCFQKIGMGK